MMQRRTTIDLREGWVPVHIVRRQVCVLGWWVTYREDWVAALPWYCEGSAVDA